MLELSDIRPGYLEVDVDRVLENIRLIRKRLGPDVKLMVPVKGNFYGLGVRGLLPLIDDQVDYYALALVSEALEVRRLGSTKEILLLSYTPRSQYKYLLDYNLMPSIFSYEDAKVLSDLAEERNKVHTIHLALDTGMTRIGFDLSDQSLADIEKISKLRGLKIGGIFTHFTSSEERDKETSYKQAKAYLDFINKLEARGVDLGLKHTSNSGAVVSLPEYNHNLVRPGSSVMGLVEEPEKYSNLPVLPTCQLKTKIVRIRTVDKGTKISYNGTYTVEKDGTKIATLALGYADGIKRQMANVGEVLIKGKRAKIRGKICMDQFMVDVTDIDCQVGDEVIVFGYEENAPVIGDVAGWSNTCKIDIISSISHRVPRVYIKDGRPVKIIDYLLDK
ncbi:alanine racemase [Neofamilia massiliensis]|uniref:alanine racemase n=1 Tax=Neofamilia massiliensis TaxID=1673724 RepID=UPI0006BB682F|nr:alanine racemase [Neofamilia massiliensis]